MQKRTEATRGSASLLHKAIACILSVMLATSYSSIAYAFDGEASDATVTTEDTSISVAAADESAESEETIDAEETDAETSADAEADEAASFDAETDGVDGSTLLLSTSDRLAVISAGAEEAASASAQTNSIQTLYEDDYFTVETAKEEGTDWTFENQTITIMSDGDYTITGDGNDHSGYQIVIEGSPSVTLTIDSVKMTYSYAAPFSISGTANVTLNLEGENSFTAGSLGYAGIEFEEATTGSLEITSSSGGSLTAKAMGGGAGIGGGRYGSASNITISGGIVTATGGYRAAGIGGGSGGSASNITITGGTVTATSGSSDNQGGAGIGSGATGVGSASNITITGGTVIATGSAGGAGIGGGSYASVSDITITGGTITATGGGLYGAGIGSGIEGDASNITITGGTVTATGGDRSAGIGGGYKGSASDIEITGGAVIATGSNSAGGDYGAGAGIGSGAYGDANNITISGGAITAIAGNSNADAIGSGEYGDSATNITVDYEGDYYWRSSSSASFTFSDTDPLILPGRYTYIQIYPEDAFQIHFTLEDPEGQITYYYAPSTIAITSGGNWTLTGDDCEDHSGYQVTIVGGITVSLTINNVKITNSPDAPMDITNTSKVTLYLEGENSFTAGNYCAGIQFQNASESASLTITSNSDGSLTATGGTNGAGIGGGRYGSASNITISGGTVTATGGYNAAGIGGGYWSTGTNITISGGTVTATGGQGSAGIGGGYNASASNITISGGTVTATGNDGGAGIGGVGASASNIVISGGSVKASSISVTPTNGDESNPQNVYLCKIEGLSGVNEVTVDHNTIYTRNGDHPDGDGAFYLYLTGEDHLIYADGTAYIVKWDDSSSAFDIPFTVTTDKTYGTDWVLESSAIVIKSTGVYAITGDGNVHSGYQIKIEGSPSVDLAIKDVKITNLSTTSFNISNTANVTLYLEGENSFTSAAYGYAGIQFADASEGASLTITSNTNGSLTATGGDYAAGIGGGNRQAGNYITISGGTVTAQGGYGAAGIGGGDWASGSYITITGGTVTATGGWDAAGIGGGDWASGSYITISGGTVTATAGNSNADAIGSGGDSGSAATDITVNYGDIGYYWRTASSAAFTSSATSAITLPSSYTYVQIYPGDAIAESISFELDSESIFVGDTLDLSSSEYLTVSPSTYNLDHITWSSDSDCVTVDESGTITGVAAGTATITVSAIGLSGSEITAQITIFVNKITPTASDFTFTAPTDAIYDGQPKEASVSVASGIIGMGEIVSVAYSSDGYIWDTSAPVYPGTYLVRIVVAEGANYTAATVESDEWTFSIDKDKSGWTRLAGDTRYETMAAVVQEAFADDSSDYVVIASGQNFADSLTASSLAGVLNAPIILVSADELSTDAEEQITRLGASYAYIVGGTSSVSESVLDAVEDILGSGNVTRVSGSDRYATAVEVAKTTVSILEERGKTLDTVILASGTVYADALSISPYAYTAAAPIILVGSDGMLDADSAAWIALSDATSLIIAGGTSSVSGYAVGQTGITNSRRLAGSDRYETSVAIANWALDNEHLSADGTVIASGQNFPDALSSSALCGQLGSVLILVPSSSRNIEVENFIAANASSITYGYTVGGTGSVSEAVEAAIKEAAGLNQQ